MYQMICPVLERLQAMEGGDASDGAGTGTEIDEVRGGLRAHPSGWLEPGGGGGGSGCLGAHLPALYEAEGADGLYDRRLGRLSARRAPVDEVARVLELFDTPTGTSRPSTSTRSWWPIGFKRSYNWLRLSLQAHGRRRAAPRRGAHRRKRPRRALPGMMLHQTARATSGSPVDGGT